jgi:hypothetical protein
MAGLSHTSGHIPIGLKRIGDYPLALFIAAVTPSFGWFRVSTSATAQSAAKMISAIGKCDTLPGLKIDGCIAHGFGKRVRR